MAQRQNLNISENFYLDTINWYVCLKSKNRARNTSILIGEYYENFINGQIATGKYSSVVYHPFIIF
ncbi:type II toxin-antitoxin system ParD family antitoxin [Nonlabens sp.]|uniref:type II toxin-antitoxin system ParD family antitoxin n=1 Tax=Nonlabens sp. TaxID=1888209 RepID=UPI0025F9A6E9|nr:type II toxin-antitoxin system ParD family antitoxin [Nonlabens sp.]